jgi:urease accessory protein
MSRAALLLLADSRFPTGAHAHGAGVESSYARGDLRSLADLSHFLDGRVATVGPTEAAFAAASCRPDADWSTLDRELSARTPSPKLRTVSRSLGRQLVRAAQRAWPTLPAERLRALHPQGPMQPVALGAVAATAGLEPMDAALCSLHHLVGAVTTAAVRLLGLDPFDVQALAARAAGHLEALAADAADAAERTAHDPALLPADNSLLADILAEHHATWEVRLFAS